MISMRPGSAKLWGPWSEVGGTMSDRPVRQRRVWRWVTGFALGALVASTIWWGSSSLGSVLPSGGRAVDDRIPGADATDAQPIEGSSGQAVAANVPPSAGGPERPSAVAPSLWWAWTAPADGIFAFATHGSEFDTVLRVYSGDAQDDLTEIAANDNDGDVTTSSTTIDATEGETYQIQVSAKSGESGLATLAWNEVTESSGFSANQYTSIPISVNTGEKPQSKTWEHDGIWWAVLASTDVSPEGAWLWKLGDDGAWTNVLHLSDSTSVRGDAKQDGDVTHILLHGSSSTLVSIEYVPSEQTYTLWGDRPVATPVSLPGSETATIDIDTTGRMWLAADAPTSVRVHYSDAPYNAFAGPVTLASNITDDDIAMVTALSGGKIGVLWSNQTTKRFGFRTHADGTVPGTWTTDEVPAGSSALSVGSGMSDDHLNVALASDGTLYAAIKTSYNSSNHPVIGLLVRHPNGTWDPLHEVDQIGTRPIVLLNEQDQTVRVVYTESEQLDDIVAKSSSTGNIDFGDRYEVLDGSFNNATSTKSNWTDRVLVLASSASEARHAFLDPGVPSGEPVVGDSSVATTEGVPVDGVFEVVSSSGGDLTFEVVDGPSLGEVVITDAFAGEFTYTPDGGAVGVDGFTFRVREGDVWSQPAAVTVTITPGSGLRGLWSMEEGGGATVGDGSGLGNDGAVRGSPTWVERQGGLALHLDGSSDYVTVADDPSLDLADAATMAMWVRPDRVATQYLIKKAGGSTDGFELSLSSSTARKVFVRFNQVSSGNTYRVDSVSTYPANGLTWMHVAATYDGSTIRLYIDGELEASGPGPSSISVNDLQLAFGAQPDGTSKFGGAIDDVRVYDRALTAQQIADLASS